MTPFTFALCWPCRRCMCCACVVPCVWLLKKRKLRDARVLTRERADRRHETARTGHARQRLTEAARAHSTQAPQHTERVERGGYFGVAKVVVTISNNGHQLTS